MNGWTPAQLRAKDIIPPPPELFPEREEPFLSKAMRGISGLPGAVVKGYVSQFETPEKTQNLAYMLANIAAAIGGEQTVGGRVGPVISEHIRARSFADYMKGTRQAPIGATAEQMMGVESLRAEERAREISRGFREREVGLAERLGEPQRRQAVAEAGLAEAKLAEYPEMAGFERRMRDYEAQISIARLENERLQRQILSKQLDEADTLKVSERLQAAQMGTAQLTARWGPIASKLGIVTTDLEGETLLDTLGRELSSIAPELGERFQKERLATLRISTTEELEALPETLEDLIVEISGEEAMPTMEETLAAYPGKIVIIDWETKERAKKLGWATRPKEGELRGKRYQVLSPLELQRKQMLGTPVPGKWERFLFGDRPPPTTIGEWMEFFSKPRLP